VIGFIGILVGVAGVRSSSKRKIESIVENKLKGSTDAERVRFKKELKLCLQSSDIQKEIASIVQKTGTPHNPEKKEHETNSKTSIASPKYLLYTRETDSDEVNVESSDYCPGKSVYRITLDSADATNGTIEPCVDRDDTKSLILQEGKELLRPICEVTEEASSPQKIVIKSKGNVEKISGTKWRVTKKINIEFR